MIIILQCYVGFTFLFRLGIITEFVLQLKKGTLHWILKTKDEMKI